MYVGSNTGTFSQINASSLPTITASNGINLNTVLSSNFADIYSITLNTAGTRAYIGCVGGANGGGYLILDITGSSAWTSANVLSSVSLSSTQACGGTCFVNLNAHYGSGTTACALFSVPTTTASSGNLYAYDVSGDTLSSTQIGSFTGITGSNVSEMLTHPSNPTVIYMNSSQTLTAGNTPYLWVFQIASNGTLSLITQIAGTGSITNGYVSGNFVTYNNKIYYVLNSNNGYFNIFNATNPTSPSNPVLMTLFPQLSPPTANNTNIIQTYINSSFQLYTCNRTTASTPVLNVYTPPSALP